MATSLKISLISIFLLLLIGFTLYSFIDKPLPQGEEGPAAEALANKMLRALNKEAWDTTFAVRWSLNNHDYLWDRKNDNVQVIWDNYRALLNTKEVNGFAYKDNVALENQSHEKAIATAWKFFANDSFWLIAPYKIRDPGTRRYLVKRDEGDALMVHYTSGGVTPGDKYLWLLNDDGTPKAWSLWVKIIPVGGIEFTWEDWKTFESGARIALLHRGPRDIQITNVSVGKDVAALNGGINPFN